MTTFLVTISIVVVILLVLSLWGNIFLFRRLLNISDNLDELLYNLGQYNNHLEKVYNMETFYGNEIMQGLLEHSKETVSEVESFRDNYGGEVQTSETEEEAA